MPGIQNQNEEYLQKEILNRKKALVTAKEENDFSYCFQLSIEINLLKELKNKFVDSGNKLKHTKSIIIEKYQ